MKLLRFALLVQKLNWRYLFTVRSASPILGAAYYRAILIIVMPIKVVAPILVRWQYRLGSELEQNRHPAAERNMFSKKENAAVNSCPFLKIEHGT